MPRQILTTWDRSYTPNGGWRSQVIERPALPLFSYAAFTTRCPARINITGGISGSGVACSRFRGHDGDHLHARAYTGNAMEIWMRWKRCARDGSNG